jgi:Fic family protein
MNRWTELTEALSQLPIFENVNSVKKQLDGIRPLSQEVEGRVMQKLRLEWNYHSNAIEGNKLTYGETYSFLMYGLTAKGKPFKDHLDIKGHNDAINFLTSLIKDDYDLTEVDIRGLHKMILVESYASPAQTHDGQATTKMIRVGEYKQQPNHVLTPTGEIHYFANPEEVPIKMHELVSFYNEARKNPKIHPSVLAAFVHHRFVNIHPFDDGNGRLARILMNLILMKNGYPPAIIKLKERTDYYAALNQADKNEYQPITELIAETVLESMNLYLKAARGESIEDVSDLDKEIALFKGSFEKTYEIKSKETVLKTFEQAILPIVKIAEIKFSKLDDLFHERKNTYYYIHKSWNFSNNFRENNLSDIYQDWTQFLKIHIEWIHFNRVLKRIDFETDLICVLDHKTFEIKFKEIVLLTKFYGEFISDLEKEKVASDWLRLTFDDLKKEIEEANKK